MVLTAPNIRLLRVWDNLDNAKGVFMTQEQFNRGLRLVRYGGVVITITVFIVLLAFMLIIGNSIDAATGGSTTGLTLSATFPYIIGFTVLAAVLSVVLYFGYRMYASRRMQSPA